MAISVQDVTTLGGCRSCGSQAVVDLFDLRPVPVDPWPLDRPHEIGEQSELVPVGLSCCEQCGLVQLRQTPRPDRRLERDRRRDGTRPGYPEQLESLATAIDRVWLPYDGTIVDVSCNDGTLLGLVRHRRPDARLVGVEPSRHLRTAAAAADIDVTTSPLDESLVSDLLRRHGPADVLVARSLLARVDDVQGSLWAMFKLLAHDGVAILEVDHLLAVVESTLVGRVGPDSICYFSLTSLLALLDSAGLRCLQARSVPTNGGGLEVVVCGPSSSRQPSDDSIEGIERILSREAAAGLADPRTYDRLDERISSLAATSASLYGDLAAAGRRLLCYGAGAHTVALVHQLGLAGVLDAVVDGNELVQDRFVAGTDLPIIPPQALPSRHDRYCLLAEWEHAGPVLRELRTAGFGGQAIVPCPEPRFPADHRRATGSERLSW